MNSWIAEISLVHPTGGVIESFKKQESAMKRMKVRQIKLEKRELNARNAKLIEANKQRIGKKGTRLKEIAKGHSKSVIAAFVVFNCEESKNRCIEDYVETGSTFFRYFQPTFLNMVKDGKHYKLRVEGAPTPSLVFWENLHLSDFERFMRVSLTTAITTILLILSFAMIYVTNLYNQSGEGQEGRRSEATTTHLFLLRTSFARPKTNNHLLFASLILCSLGFHTRLDSLQFRPSSDNSR